MMARNDVPVVKVEPTIDGDGESGKHDSGGACRSDIWVKVHDISLTFEDKHILEQGEKLTDKHINCAQRILKLKFPGINGLRLTLLQGQAHKQSTTNAVQIFHVNDDHWVCGTTVGTTRKEVLIYDSWYTKWDQATLGIIRKQFRCNTQSIKVVKKIQKQETGVECGLFAVANATTIAFGKDPTKFIYDEKRMREHLVYCFPQKDLELFPLIHEM